MEDTLIAANEDFYWGFSFDDGVGETHWGEQSGQGDGLNLYRDDGSGAGNLDEVYINSTTPTEIDLPVIDPGGLTMLHDVSEDTWYWATEPWGYNFIDIDIDIDIKPGSDSNSINLKSKGVVPVAVLTTDDFDASTVDPETVLFAGASPVRSTLDDVDGDGDLDMLFHFKTQDLEELDKDSTDATLMGQTTSGIPIAGTDSVNIVPKKDK